MHNNNPRQAIAFLSLLAGVLFFNSAPAEEVSYQLPGGLTALAEYHRGDPQKPAILVLHGFLQTPNYNTLQFITSELIADDNTVLAPTLTLNITRRKRSLTCDAIQSHTSDDANREIGIWIEWLKARGHHTVILVGHSFGSAQLVDFLKHHFNPAVKGLILTSLGTSWDHKNPAQMEKLVELAERRLAENPHSIDKYSLAYCQKNYAAPPGAFRSYARWSEEYVLNTLEQSPVPVLALLGGADGFLPEGWSAKLEQRGVKVTVLAGANHFFSGDSEFEFQETLLDAVRQVTATP
jgi:pimeloyl-ACP methyl ester carboxylesterase